MAPDGWRNSANRLTVAARPENPCISGVNTPRPLDNFPLVRSHKIDELCEAFGRAFIRPTRLTARGVEALNITFNNCRLQNIGLAYTTYGADVQVDFPPTGFFLQVFPLRGSAEIIYGQTTVPVRAGSSAVISPEIGHVGNFGADYEHLVLRIGARLLTDKLAAMTGATIKEPLRLEPEQDFKHPSAQILQQYLPFLVDTLSGARPPFPDWWVAQTEQLLMTLFLCGHRHNYSHLMEQSGPDAAPRQVRQAEEFIVANAERTITLEELAELTGVSSFGLFSTFRKHRGYSPLEFLAQVRSRRRRLS